MPHSHLSRVWYSFGVEIEFIIKFSIDDFTIATDPALIGQLGCLKMQRAVYRQLVSYLRKVGFGVNDYSSHCVDLTLWTVKKASSVEADEFDVELDDWGFCPVKLAAPVMSYVSPFIGEFDRILRLLKENFGVFVNDSCSLNVHVGIVDSPDSLGPQSFGFPLSTLRNLLTFVWIFQNQMDAIHAPARVTDSKFVRPSDLFSDVNPRIVKRYIRECTSVQALYEFWDGSITSGTPVYSIKDMKTHNSNNVLEFGNRTVRFSQHKGTLDAEEIYHWVMLVGHIVRITDNCVPWGWPLEILLDAGLKKPVKLGGFSTVKLLNAIGAGEQAKYYSEKLHHHEDSDGSFAAGGYGTGSAKIR